MKHIVSKEIKGKIFITNIYITLSIWEHDNAPSSLLVAAWTSKENRIFIWCNVRNKCGALGTPQTGVIQLSDFYRVLAICWWWLKQNKAQMDLSPKLCLFIFFAWTCLNFIGDQDAIHFGGVHFYSDRLLVCNYSQLIFKLLNEIKNAMNSSFKNK